MRIIILFAIATLFVSCKDETKKEKVIETTQKIPEVVKPVYPKLEGVPQSLNFIFEDGYLFSDDIEIEEIAAYKTGEDNYNFVVYLSKKTNIEALQEMTLGFVAYPKDLSVLKTAKEKKTKSKASGYSTEVFSLDDSPVLSIKDFKIETNEFNLVKIYFYNKGGVLNDRTLKIRNLKI